MTEEVFTDSNESKWSGYKAWEARCKSLGLNGPYRIWGSAQWQFTDKSGTAAIYNAGAARGVIFDSTERNSGVRHD